MQVCGTTDYLTTNIEMASNSLQFKKLFSSYKEKKNMPSRWQIIAHWRRKLRSNSFHFNSSREIQRYTLSHLSKSDSYFEYLWIWCSEFIKHHGNCLHFYIFLLLAFNIPRNLSINKLCFEGNIFIWGFSPVSAKLSFPWLSHPMLSNN